MIASTIPQAFIKKVLLPVKPPKNKFKNGGEALELTPVNNIPEHFSQS